MIENFICPRTKLALRQVRLAEARAAIGVERLQARTPSAASGAPFGETETMLLRSDNRAAYPVVDGFPILLGPEVLTSPEDFEEPDLGAPQYAEAYAEMPFYNAEAAREAEEMEAGGTMANSSSRSIRSLHDLAKLSEAERADFPDPPETWLIDTVDVASTVDCYRFIAPVKGKTVAQIGGKGTMTLTLLFAGAETGILITPMLGEAMVGRSLARLCGLEDRFQAVIAIAEELPIADNSIDRCMSGGCVHHMRTEIAFAEISRTLSPGGRFGAIEPWRAPLYAIGTRVFGKREPNAFCRPIDRARAAPLFEAFDRAQVVHHGALLRYPMIVAEKMGIKFSPKMASRLIAADDRFSNLVPGLRSTGSGLTLLGEKSA